MKTPRLALGLATIALATALVGCSKSDAAPDGIATLQDGGGTATTAPAANAGDNEAKLRDYAKCMRDNGVTNFPDPQVGSDGQPRLDGFQNSGIDRQSQQFRDAQQKCRDKLQGVTFGRGNIDTTKLQDASLKYVKCLRDQGLTVKDPDFSQLGQGGGPGGFGGGGQGRQGQAGGQGGQGQGAQGQAPGGTGGGGAPNGGPGQGGRGGRGTGFIARALGLDENDPAVQKAQEACQSTLQQAMQDAGIQPPGGGAPGGADGSAGARTGNGQ